MSNIKNIKGKRFGRLLVVDIHKDYGYGNWLWLCRCNCGIEKYISRTNLQNGNSNSCGCLQKERTSFANSIEKNKAAFNSIYDGYRKKSQNKNIEFNLSELQFKKITQSNCCYCGEKPSYVSKTNNGIFVYNGIDRINSKLGYILTNSVPCCWKCNRAKNTMSVDEFKSHIVKIYDFLLKYQE